MLSPMSVDFNSEREIFLPVRSYVSTCSKLSSSLMAVNQFPRIRRLVDGS